MHCAFRSAWALRWPACAWAGQATAQVKTRADVRQELLQARHDGYLPNRRTNFPPDASMVARSRQLHRLTIHRGESSPGFDEHDTRDPAARPAQ